LTTALASRKKTNGRTIRTERETEKEEKYQENHGDTEASIWSMSMDRYRYRRSKIRYTRSRIEGHRERIIDVDLVIQLAKGFDGDGDMFGRGLTVPIDSPALAIVVILWSKKSR
jgi:hypothetical protein